jgi:hypothetical protein
MPRIDGCIYACFEDGTKEPIEDLSAYVIVNEVDEAEVAAYIDDLREKARQRDADAYAKSAQEGKPFGMVTGGVPLYMLNRDNLIKREIEARRYSWK